MIYLGGVIQGSSTDNTLNKQDYRVKLKYFFKKNYPTIQLFCPNDDYNSKIDYFKDRSEFDKFEYLLNNLKTAKYFIGYFPTASNGTAIELYVAYNLKIPTISISPMTKNWALRAYSKYFFESIEQFEGNAIDIFNI